jgi:hypothetical protein
MDPNLYRKEYSFGVDWQTRASMGRLFMGE